MSLAKEVLCQRDVMPLNPTNTTLTVPMSPVLISLHGSRYSGKLRKVSEDPQITYS